MIFHIYLFFCDDRWSLVGLHDVWFLDWDSSSVFLMLFVMPCSLCGQGTKVTEECARSSTSAQSTMEGATHMRRAQF